MYRLFKESPHPDEKQRQQLSKQLGLAPRQVKFWFQNRRTQIKVCNPFYLLVQNRHQLVGIFQNFLCFTLGNCFINFLIQYIHTNYTVVSLIYLSYVCCVISKFKENSLVNLLIVFVFYFWKMQGLGIA